MAQEDLTFRLSLRDKAAFTRGMDDATDSIRRADRAADRAGRSFLTMGRLASGARTAVGGIVSVARTAATGIGILTGAVTAAGVALFRLGADAQETAGKFEVTFGAVTDEAQEWVEDMHRRFGFARADLQEIASGFGILGRAADLSGGQLVRMGTELSNLALDLSSKFNVGIEEAATALRSGLVGETEPLRRFGIVLNQAMVDAQGAAMGFGDELTEQERVLARWALIMEMGAQHTGDLAATQGQASNQARAFWGRLKELATIAGDALVPALEEIFPLLNDGLLVATDRLVDRMPEIQDRTRDWARRAVELARSLGGVVSALVHSGIESDRFKAAVDEAFGPRVAGIVQDLVDRYAQLRTNIADLGVRQGVVQTVEEMFGPRAASIVDSLTSSAQSLATIFTDALIPAFGAAYDRLGPLLGQVTESGLQLLAHVLGWAAENAEALQTPIAVLFGVWLTNRTVTTITRIATALRGLATAIGLTAAASGGAGVAGAAGGALAGAASAGRGFFSRAWGFLAGVLGIGGGVALTGAAASNQRIGPEELEEWGIEPGDPLWVAAGGDPATVDRPSGSGSISRVPQAAGVEPPPQIPEGLRSSPGAGGGVHVGLTVNIDRAWDGEDIARMLQERTFLRGISDAILRELEVVGARQ